MLIDLHKELKEMNERIPEDQQSLLLPRLSKFMLGLLADVALLHLSLRDSRFVLILRSVLFAASSVPALPFVCAK